MTVPFFLVQDLEFYTNVVKSEDIKFDIIQNSCFKVLFYDIDIVSLKHFIIYLIFQWSITLLPDVVLINCVPSPYAM